jgi:hypothetical protein
MRKSILSLSVTAALAIPAISVAQQAAPAAPAVPTLDKVLEASGLSVSGYIDTAYQHANRNIETGFSPRVFDSQNNSFVLHQFGLQVAKQPKEGFGGLVNITAGKDAQVIHSFPESSGSMFDITQAFAQYASGPLTVIAGKFTTLHGTEVIWSPSNANFSRSILFGAVPFTHTGVRASYAPMDTVTLYGGLNNGWDQLTDQNKGKTLELGVTATPIKPLTLSASYYGGKEISPITTVDGRRNSINFVASYTVIEPLTLGLEHLRVGQKDGVSNGAGGTKDAKYNGTALYASYAFMPKFKASLRTEWFKDTDQFHFGAPAGTTNTKYKEITLTLAYLAADNFELRGELRSDRADVPIYTDGANLSKSLTTFAIQALYKF